MVLGSAVSASADGTGGKQAKESYMAHMWCLLIPLAMIGKGENIGLKVLIVEGTGCVWPDQADNAQPPTFFVGNGKDYSDKLMPEMRGIVRRVIFQPAAATSPQSDVVAEFYEHAVSMIMDDPEEGMMVAFDNQVRILFDFIPIFPF